MVEGTSSFLRRCKIRIACKYEGNEAYLGVSIYEYCIMATAYPPVWCENHLLQQCMPSQARKLHVSNLKLTVMLLRADTST